MLRVAICEDEPLQAEVILALLEKYQAERPGMEIHPYSFDSGNKLLQNIDGGQEFNLFLLDILLPEMNGIELARKLRAKYTDVPMVFLTSSTEYALDAFNVSAAQYTQYILKPVKTDVLFPVLDNITAALKRQKERFFLLTMQKHTVKISYGSIVCVELARRALRFYLENGDILLSNTIRISFSEAIYPLLMDGRFLYEHKSFVLNMDHVKEIGSASFKMKGGLEVPIPKYNFAKAKARYVAWLNDQNVSD